jgi:small GTP-binding protein
MTMYLILTGKLPFPDAPTPFAISRKVENGIRPQIPDSVPEPYRVLMECCWAGSPHDRPTMLYVVGALSTYKALNYIFGRNLSPFRTYQQRVRHSDSTHSYNPKKTTLAKNLQKIVFIGEPSTGKTTLFNRIKGEEYETRAAPTIGTATETIDVMYRRREAQTRELWDTAGQEIYRSVTVQYIRGSACAIVVFALPDRRTFDGLPFWVNFIKGQMVPFILIGAQADLEKPREVEAQIADQFGMEEGALAYLEVSAKWGDCVHEILAQIEVAIAEIGASAVVLTRRLSPEGEPKKSCC